VGRLILALTFGSLVAMGMPIITAVLGPATALGLIGLLGHVVNIPTVGPTLATAAFPTTDDSPRVDGGRAANVCHSIAVGRSLRSIRTFSSQSAVRSSS
jgi:MMPL family